ncbi:MAG: methyltransferase [Pseudolysinimonas sp.]|uniref:methyltransferase n=1 Tax=Pseudolysinimonas sp. TaxID=2680009 RepID=UPI003267F65A
MAENTMMTGQRWIAFGPAGALGSIHRTADGFSVRLLDDSPARDFPSLEVAKSALHATLPTGSEWPEFREH